MLPFIVLLGLSSISKFNSYPRCGLFFALMLLFHKFSMLQVVKRDVHVDTSFLTIYHLFTSMLTWFIQQIWWKRFNIIFRYDCIYCIIPGALSKLTIEGVFWALDFDIIWIPYDHVLTFVAHISWVSSSSVCGILPRWSSEVLCSPNISGTEHLASTYQCTWLQWCRTYHVPSNLVGTVYTCWRF